MTRGKLRSMCLVWTHERDDRGSWHAIRSSSFQLPPIPDETDDWLHSSSIWLTEYRKLRRSLSRTWRSTLVSLWYWGVAFGIAFYTAFLVSRGRTVGGTLMLLPTCGTAYYALRRRRMIRREAYFLHRELFGRPSICAVCSYDLASGSPDTDGCTLCPECGAAWRLDAAAPSERRQGDT